jgi:dUTP pyrophosphatase
MSIWNSLTAYFENKALAQGREDQLVHTVLTRLQAARTFVCPIKKLESHATVPSKATPGSAGFDLHALESIVLHSGSVFKVRTGLAVAVPVGYEMQIRPRSGLAAKSGITIVNSPGTIDSDYRGEVCVLLRAPAGVMYSIQAGERIAQAVFAQVPTMRFQIVSELDETARGSGGFGSTGLT